MVRGVKAFHLKCTMMPLDSLESLKVIKNNLSESKLLAGELPIRTVVRSADSLLEMPNVSGEIRAIRRWSVGNHSERSPLQQRN